MSFYNGFVFDDRVESQLSSTNFFNAKIKGSCHWGVWLEFFPIPFQSIDLSYYRQDTQAPTTYYDNNAILDPIKEVLFDLSTNYLLIGSTRYVQMSSVVEPYFGAQIGVGVAGAENPTNGRSAKATKFAWALKGGSCFWIS